MGSRANGARLRVKREVIGDEQVKVAIAIIVQESRAQTPERAAHAGRLCYIRETTTIIPPECVAAVTGDVDIRVAVAVIIGCGNPLAMPFGGKSDVLRNVLEPTISQVPQQDIGQRCPILAGQKWSSLGKEEVKPTIPVIVKDSDSPTGRFAGPGVASLAALVLKGQLLGTKHQGSQRFQPREPGA